MNHIEFLRRIDTEKLAPIYFFVGEEDYLVDKAIERISNRISPCDKYVYYGDEITLEDILKKQSEPSLFGLVKNTLIVVKRAGYLKDIKKLSELKWTSPSPVIFYFEDRKKFRFLSQKIKEKVSIVDFPLLDRRDFRKWFKKRARENNLWIEEAVVEELLQLFPKSLREAETELEKIALYSAGGPISYTDIKEIIYPNLEVSVFGIIDSALKGTKREVISQGWALLERGEPFTRIFYYLTQVVMGLLAGRADDPGVFEKAGVKKWRYNLYRTYSKSFQDRDILSKLEELRDTEVTYKSSSLNPAILLMKVLWNIAER